MLKGFGWRCKSGMNFCLFFKKQGFAYYYCLSKSRFVCGWNSSVGGYGFPIVRPGSFR